MARRNKSAADPQVEIVAYKAMERDMTCRGYQFEAGITGHDGVKAGVRYVLRKGNPMEAA